MTQTSMFSVNFAAATDIGLKRVNNEDSFGYDAEEHIYVVCDGMGGNAAGEVASGMAVRALIETYESSSADTGLAVEERLLQAIFEANRAVHDAWEENPQLHNMGTTLVCACLDGSRIVIGNVGDSRAYLVRNRACVQITQDHSLLDEQVRHGILTQEMAANSNLQSVITRAIGISETVVPDLFAAEIQPDDLLLLTSDGLTRYAQPEEIAWHATNTTELAVICQELIAHAKQRGGADNITCMMLRVVELPLSAVASVPESTSAEL